MHQHGQKTLTGPIIGTKAWWQEVVGLPACSREDRPSKSRKKPLKKAKNHSRQDHIPGHRQELIARIRLEIAAGTYDTPEKWDLALERLLGRLGY